MALPVPLRRVLYRASSILWDDEWSLYSKVAQCSCLWALVWVYWLETLWPYGITLYPLFLRTSYTTVRGKAVKQGDSRVTAMED